METDIAQGQLAGWRTTLSPLALLLSSTLLLVFLVVQTQRVVRGTGIPSIQARLPWGTAQGGPTAPVPSDGDNPLESPTLTLKQRREARLPFLSVDQE